MSASKERTARAKKSHAGSPQRPRVARGTQPAHDRAPRRERTFEPGSIENTLVVQFGRVDVGGPWCLTAITKDDHGVLLGRLRGFESMKVTELFSAGGEPGKDYDADQIPNDEARRRLVELELDDETQISRLRISGKGRLYGFRRDERFYALWWDPEHQVWPSKLKHT